VDHKPESYKERLRIREAGGFVTEGRRVNGILALARALGDCSLNPAVSPEPDIIEMELTSDDQYILVACDGLWDLLSNEDAIRIVGNEKDPVKAAIKLRDFALLMGSRDNISVVVVQLTHIKSPSKKFDLYAKNM